MQRIVPVLTVLLVLSAGVSSRGMAQPVNPPDLAEIQPLIPTGISDFNLDLYGRHAYTWTGDKGEQVVEIQGDFSGRMGAYQFSGRDGVVWLTRREWQGRTYLDADLFLWRDAEVTQPGGVVESGPALLITLRTFGKLGLSVDARASESDAVGELYGEAAKARRLLSAAPPKKAESSASPLRIAPTLERLQAARPKPVRKVDFTADHLSSERIGDEQVIIATGDVLVTQGSPSKSGEYVEIRADAAVIYVSGDRLGAAVPELLGDKERRHKRQAQAGKTTTAPAAESPVSEQKLTAPPAQDMDAAREWVKSVYLEGDVVLLRGERMIRAARLYYDFQNEQALIQEVVMRGIEPSRGLPIYVRAETVRQVAAHTFQAEKAQFSTSEFHTPHLAIAAETLELTDRTPRDEAGNVKGVQAGTYTATHTSMNLEGLPIAYWPVSKGDFANDRMAFESASTGYNKSFGYTFETRWQLFNLLGLEPPPGYDASLELDYLTKRGPGFGIDSNYKQDNYYGFNRNYYIDDHGEDRLGPIRSSYPPRDFRGRSLWRHRQFLPEGWELTLEGSYISDHNFLEQYYRNEFENGKAQETLINLIKRQDNWYLSSLANYRTNFFLTQTEHLPDNFFSLVGEPLGDLATLYSESRAGVVRYKFDDASTFGLVPTRPNEFESTGSVMRGDKRDELAMLLPDLGPMKLTPYVAGRVTGYDDNPKFNYGHSSGGFARLFGAYGLRGNMMLSKVDESVESDLLGLHHLRHIIKPDFQVWGAHSNRQPQELSPFDPEVENIVDASGGTVGVRQKLQTQRGGPGRWRTVDWIILDLETGFFSNAQFDENTHGDVISSRPEDSITSNFLSSMFQYRLSDTTVFVYESVYDWNRGSMGTTDLSIAVERDPRLAYFVGWRYINVTNDSLLAFGTNYRLSEKHIVAFREMYDLDAGRNYSTDFIYIRKWPRWYTAISLDVDKAIDDVGISVSAWPEGAAQLGVGSKRYTGLTDSIGMNLR